MLLQEEGGGGGAAGGEEQEEAARRQQQQPQQQPPSSYVRLLFFGGLRLIASLGNWDHQQSCSFGNLDEQAADQPSCCSIVSSVQLNLNSIQLLS